MFYTALTLIGFVLSFWIATGRLGHSAGEAAWAVIATQIASGVALSTTLYCQRSRRLKFLTLGPLRSWVMLMTLSLGILLGLCPWLREPAQLGWMFIPLCLVTGLMLMIFGPVQDRLLKRASARRR